MNKKNSTKKLEVGNSKDYIKLKRGDMVKIKTKKEIEKTLDSNKRYQGCGFMEGMWQYCGGTYKVLKRVEIILDPWKNKLRKCDNIVALEGLFCNGDPIVSPECDRTCIFYWNEAWLEKIPC
jgi:hypothetical protein